MTTRSLNSLLVICALASHGCTQVGGDGDANPADAYLETDAAREPDAGTHGVNVLLRREGEPDLLFAEAIVAPVDLLFGGPSPDRSPLALGLAPGTGTCEIYRDGDIANRPWLVALIGTQAVMGGFLSPPPGVYPVGAWGTPATPAEARVAFNPLPDDETDRRVGVDGTLEILEISPTGAQLRFQIGMSDGSRIEGEATALPCDGGPWTGP